MVRRILIGCGGVFLLLLLGVGAFLCIFLRREPGEYFDSNGVRLYYTSEGAGEPLILVHGLAVNADLNWRRPGITEMLAKHFRVIALDLRAHGRSDTPKDPDQYGLPMVEDITRLMDHLHVSKAHFAGYSMGGALLLKFMSLHPERVQSAAICASGWADPEVPSPIPKLNRLLERLRKTEPAPASIAAGGAPEGASLAVTHEGSQSKSYYRRAKQWLNSQIIDEAAKNALKQKYGDWAVPRKDLERMKMPVLCIAGSDDEFLVLDQALKDNLPSAHLVVIPGATHLTTPFHDKFRDTLLQFFLDNPGGLGQE